MKTRWRRIALPSVVIIVGAAAACDLNPQPLPPLDPNQASAGKDRDAGAGFGGSPDAAAPEKATDAGNDDLAPDGSTDGGEDADSDAGDTGDGGDAG